MDAKQWKKLLHENTLNEASDWPEDLEHSDVADEFEKVYDKVLGKKARNQDSLSNAQVKKIEGWIKKKYKMKKVDRNDMNDVIDALSDLIEPTGHGSMGANYQSYDRY